MSTLCSKQKGKNWSVYSLKMHSFPNPNSCLDSFSVVPDKIQLGIVRAATHITQLLPEDAAVRTDGGGFTRWAVTEEGGRWRSLGIQATGSPHRAAAVAVSLNKTNS